MRHSMLFSIVWVITATSGASAQMDVPAPSVPIPHPATMLLREPAVYRELKLPLTQAEDLDPILEPIERLLWRLRDVHGERRQTEAEGLLKQLHEKVALVLPQEAYQRFLQLERQALGLQALLLPEVVATLELTQGQTEQIRTHLRRLNRDLRRTQTHVSNPTQSHVREVFLRSRAKQDVLALLWSAQRDSFQDLLGPTFNFSVVKHRACRAPELKDVTAWINSPPLTLSSLRGKVVVVHFYTYGCINCIHNLPIYNRWQERFPSAEFQIVGIHRPELQSEYALDQVQARAKEADIQYPIAVDNKGTNWDAWANTAWPSLYVIDKQGFVRLWWVGELNWAGTDGEQRVADRIAALLREE